MRARALPPVVQQALGLRGSERVLAWARVDGGPEADWVADGADGAAGAAGEGTAADGVEGASGDAAGDVAEGSPVDVAEGSPGDVAQGSPGDVAEGAAEGADRAAAVWVATTSGLRAGVAQELPWDAIAEMSWDAPQLRIRPLRGGEIVGRLRAGGELAAQVRARVEASIVHSRRAPLLADGRGVLVVARRVGPERRISWAVVFDPGVDPENPVHRERAMAFLARVRAQIGL